MSLPPSTSISPFGLPAVPPSVIHMLDRAVQLNAEGEAVVVDPFRLSYRDLVASVNSLAGHLRSMGANGDRVAIALPNSVDAVVAILAVMASGAQAVLINPSYRPREFDQLMSDAQPVLLICTSERMHSNAETIARTTRRSPIVLQEYDGAFVRRSESAQPALIAPLPDAESLALLLYTGGTTGQAKGVNISHRTLALNISQRAIMLPSRKTQERTLGMTPLFHAYATHMVLLPALESASTAIFMRRYRPEAALEMIALEKITLFAGAPTIYNGLIKHPRFPNTEYGTLVGAFSGAAPLSVETLSTWERTTGVPIAEGYGLTEATGILCFNPLYGVRKPGSVGLPLPLTEVQIVDIADGEVILPFGQVGEIRARGPQLMVGYRNQPIETANMIRNGWLYTGDIGELDEDGYVYIRDRKKDMVIVSGYNVYPREIDEVLFAHPDILEAVTVGLPDPYRGETIGVCVALKCGSSIDAAALLDHCQQNLTAYKVPTIIHFMPEIPKTAAGKIDRRAARSIILDATAAKAQGADQ